MNVTVLIDSLIPFLHLLVSVRWRLHFEFTIVSETDVTSTELQENKSNEPQNDEKEHVHIPSNLRTELMLWDLPLHVVATNPIQASLMVQTECCENVSLET